MKGRYIILLILLLGGFGWLVKHHSSEIYDIIVCMGQGVILLWCIFSIPLAVATYEDLWDFDDVKWWCWINPMFYIMLIVHLGIKLIKRGLKLADKYL